MLSLLTSFFSHKTQSIVVFSDISWNTLSHFSRYLFRTLTNQGNILFIEMSFTSQVFSNEKVSISYPEKDIAILQYHSTIEQVKQKLPLFIAKQLRKQKMKEPILWFCSPVGSEIIQYLNHSIVVFDYTNKKPGYLIYENRLFSAADIVFTKDYFPSEDHAVSVKLWNESSSKIENSIKQALKRKREMQLQLARSHVPLVPQLISGG